MKQLTAKVVILVGLSVIALFSIWHDYEERVETIDGPRRSLGSELSPSPTVAPRQFSVTRVDDDDENEERGREED